MLVHYLDSHLPLSIQWQPLADVAPLPAVSLVTIGAFFLTGVGAGLTCVFIGQECFKQHKAKKAKEVLG